MSVRRWLWVPQIFDPISLSLFQFISLTFPLHQQQPYHQAYNHHAVLPWTFFTRNGFNIKAPYGETTKVFCLVSLYIKQLYELLKSPQEIRSIALIIIIITIYRHHPSLNKNTTNHNDITCKKMSCQAEEKRGDDDFDDAM